MKYKEDILNMIYDIQSNDKEIMKHKQDIIRMIYKIQEDNQQIKHYQSLIYGLSNEVQRFETNIVILENLLVDLEALGVTVKIDKAKFPNLVGSDCPFRIAKALGLIG